MENKTASKLHFAFFSDMLILRTAEVYRFFQHLLNTYYLPGCLLGAVDTKKKKKRHSPHPAGT